VFKVAVVTLLLLVTAAIDSAPAAADAAERILLVSVVDKLSTADQRQLRQLIAAFGAQTPRHGPELAAAIERAISVDPGSMDAALHQTKLIDSGRREFLEGNYRKAIIALSAALKNLSLRDALLARNQQLRTPLHEALLYLAHAHLREKENNRAVAVLTDTIRIFPDHHPALAKYGPDLVQLYRKVTRELSKQQRATLTLKSRRPGCSAFLNGRYIGVTPTKAANLLPGKYRVFMQRPNSPGRVHVIDISGSPREVTINHALDAAIVRLPLVGLRYATTAARRASEHDHALAVARAIDAQQVTILGFVRHLGRRVIQGQVLGSATGRVLRSALLAVEPTAPTPAETKALARFLLSGQGGAGVIIGTAKPVPPSAGGSGKRDGGLFSARVWRWITLGIGVAALGTAIPLLVIDGKGTCGQDRCPDTYQTLVPGAALAAAGGAAIAASVVLFLVEASNQKKQRRATSTATLTATITPWFGAGAAGLSASGRF